jgi:hypothetical protein
VWTRRILIFPAGRYGSTDLGHVVTLPIWCVIVARPSVPAPPVARPDLGGDRRIGAYEMVEPDCCRAGPPPLDGRGPGCRPRLCVAVPHGVS